MSPYLSTRVNANSLQFRAHSINNIHEIPKQRHVPLGQTLKIVRVSIRGVESMGHIIAYAPQLLDVLFHRIHKVDCDEINAWVGPIVGQPAP